MIAWSQVNEKTENGAVELLDSTSMSGQVRLSIHRPQGLYRSLHAEGRRHDVVIACKQPESLVVGVGIRSEKECYIDGHPEPQTIGYLSALRLREGYRRGLLLGRGYQALYNAHQRGSARFYLTTILSENEIAMNLLTSRRAGLPVYHDWGEIRTILIDAKHLPKHAKTEDAKISVMKRSDIEEVLQFLKKEGLRRQFFPCYKHEDFDSDSGLLPQLKTADILLMRDDNGLAGCIGTWDQSHFKSWAVTGYGFPFKAMRHVHNVWARFKDVPTWPKPGQLLRTRFVSLFCMREDDLLAGHKLMTAARCHAQERGADILAWSIHERDTLHGLTKQIPGVDLKSRLFLVYWPQDLGRFKFPNLFLPPYLESGSL